jgi:hypothetical protein
MLQNNLIRTPQEYLMVRNTGQLEPLFKADQAQLNLITQENEALLKGEQVPVLATDEHGWHIPEHLALVASPAVRVNSAMVGAILAHVQQHQALAGPMMQQQQQAQPGAQGGGGGQQQQQPGGEQQAKGPQGEPVPVPAEATVTPNMVPQ